MNAYAVCARYRHTPAGRKALKFAADLALQLGEDRLHVCFPATTTQQIALLPLPAWPQAARLQERNIRDSVCLITGLVPSQIELESADYEPPAHTQAIFVDDQAAGNRNTLVPFDESGLDERGKGPLLVPFGTDQSGVRAAQLGLPLARKLGREVVFYHTTWVNNQIAASSDPQSHMCGPAQEVGRLLLAHARAAGVECRMIVETARDVVLGTLRCAIREQARLIVMSREPKILLGSYVDRALEQSAVPLLVAGYATGGAS